MPQVFRYRDEDITCPLCNHPVAEGTERIVDDVVFHAACVSDKIVECAICHEQHFIGFMSDYNGRKVCLSCRDRIRTCDHCGAPHLAEELQVIDGHHYCAECIRSMVRCEVCGTLTFREYRWHGQNLCQSCYQSRTPRGICSYHTRPLPGIVSHTDAGDKPSEKLLLGFELESGGLDYSSDADEIANSILEQYGEGEKNFHCEHDGSIPDYGFELISQPATLEWHKKFDWKNILAEMRKGGLRSNDISECGLHVHFSRAALRRERNVLLDYFFMKYSREFIKLARRTTSYASFDRYASNGRDKSELEREFNDKINHRGRYCAVNFQNRNTIEIRAFKGTLKYETFMATLECVHSLVKWINTLKDSTVDRFETVEFSAYKAYVKRHEKIYAELIAYMRERGV